MIGLAYDLIDTRPGSAWALVPTNPGRPTAPHPAGCRQRRTHLRHPRKDTTNVTTWFTADPHISHSRILRLCHRPFSNVDQMNSALIHRWNARVSPTDDVYVLGDVALGHVASALLLVAHLNGRKFLVPGNHDECWSGHSKVRPADRRRYEDVGFEILPEVYRYGDWWLCHFPAAGDSHEEDRYADHQPVIPDGDWLLHGHVHDRWRVNGRQVNVGVDAHDFYPVSEVEIRALIESQP